MRYYFRFLLLFVLLLSIEAKGGSRGSGSRRSGSSSSRGSSSGHRTTSRPQAPISFNTQTQHSSSNSRPSSNSQAPGYGWNVGQSHNNAKPSAPVNDHLSKSSASNTQSGWNSGQSHNNAKPSAPVNDHISKSSASNTQSGWTPSGGYGNHPNQNQNHGPPAYGSINHAPPPYSAGNHQGSYSPGYHAPPAYGSAGGYHAPPSYGAGGYHAPPSYGSAGGYHAPPSYGGAGGYHAAPAGGYHPQPAFNPSLGHSTTFGHGYNPPVGSSQTIIVAGEKRGIGSMVKEAVVYSATGALVNAAVNRIIPGGIYGNSWGSSHSSSSSSNYNQNSQPVNGQPSVTNTYITYNYGNGTGQPGQAAPPESVPGQVAPAGQPSSGVVQSQPAATGGVQGPPVANGPPATAAEASNVYAAAPSSGMTVAGAAIDKTNDADVPPPNPLDAFTPTGKLLKQADFENLTHSLFTKDANNAFKHITLKLQGQKTDDSTNDVAPEPLLTVRTEAYDIPTIKALINLFDNYHLNVNDTEVVEEQHKNEEAEFIRLVTESQVMIDAFNFLVANDFVSSDKFDFRDTLKRIWFSKFQRTPDPKQLNSCGFETVFMAEHVGSEILGLHNWVYYAKMEENKSLNYLGYIKQLSMENGAIVKLRSSLNEVVQPITTIFVGTSPELEMALYSLCYFIYFNGPCPVRIHEHQFQIVAYRNIVAGKEIMPTAYPEI